MIYVSLFFSIVLLVCALVFAIRGELRMNRSEGACDFLGAGVGIAVLLLCLTETWLNAYVLGCLAVPMLAWACGCIRLRYFVPLSIVAVAVPYLVYGLEAQRYVDEYRSNRERYPYESIEHRVPVLEEHPRGTGPEITGAEIDQLEYEVGSKVGGRYLSLRSLHERHVDRFSNAPGFGRFRGSALFSSEFMHAADRPSTPRQPEFDRVDDTRPASGGDETALRQLHRSAAIDFLHPEGFGFPKDRQHVAGFDRHHFSQIPGDASWRVERVELVSLLLHAKPVVYVSDTLPDMKAVRDAATRPLTEFESRSLAELRRGEHLVIDGSSGKSLMFGSLRNVDICQKCHGGQRGDLLGAFSYVLRRNQP